MDGDVELGDIVAMQLGLSVGWRLLESRKTSWITNSVLPSALSTSKQHGPSQSVSTGSNWGVYKWKG